MLRGAVEAIVEIDIAARGIDVIAPQQAGKAASGPDTFGRTRRARELGRGLFIFLHGLVDFLLRGLLGCLLVALRFALLLLLALRLLGRLLLSARLLGESGERRQQENAARDQRGGR